MHFIALFQSVIWPLKVGDNPTLIASLGISNESCPLQDLESGLGGHEQACTKEEEDNVAHGRGGQCLPRGSWRASGWPTIEEPSRTGPEMEDDVSPGSPTYSLESDFQVRQGRIEDITLSEGDEKMFSKSVSAAYLCCNLFQLVLLLSSRFHQIFHSQFQKRPLCLPQTLLVRLNLCKNPQIMIVVIKMSNCI